MVKRFAVGGPNDQRSAVWRLWRHGNRSKADVFLAPRSLAGALKVSFHQSGEIRDAFTSEYGLQHAGRRGLKRARTIWQRADFSAGGFARLYQVVIPHSELRVWPLEPGLSEDEVHWIPAADGWDATFVELAVTAPGRESLELRSFVPATTGPLAQWYLPTGENFLALPRYGNLDQTARKHIVEAAARLPATSELVAEPSIRLHLTMEPVNGLGVTVETAWPCTVGVAA